MGRTASFSILTNQINTKIVVRFPGTFLFTPLIIIQLTLFENLPSDNLRQPLIHFSNIASIEDLTRQLYNLQSTSCAIIIRVRIGSILTSAPIILSLSLGTVSTVEGRNDQPLKHGCSKDSHRGGG